MKNALTGLVLALAISLPANAEEIVYEAEIVEHLLEPCIWEGIKETDAAKKLGKEHAIRFAMWITGKSKLQSAIDDVLPMITGRDWEARQIAYQFYMIACKDGVAEKLEKSPCPEC